MTKYQDNVLLRNLAELENQWVKMKATQRYALKDANNYSDVSNYYHVTAKLIEDWNMAISSKVIVRFVPQAENAMMRCYIKYYDTNHNEFTPGYWSSIDHPVEIAIDEKNRVVAQKNTERQSLYIGGDPNNASNQGSPVTDYYVRLFVMSTSPGFFEAIYYD